MPYAFVLDAGTFDAHIRGECGDQVTPLPIDLRTVFSVAKSFPKCEGCQEDKAYYQCRDDTWIAGGDGSGVDYSNEDWEGAGNKKEHSEVVLNTSQLVLHNVTILLVHVSRNRLHSILLTNSRMACPKGIPSG